MLTDWLNEECLECRCALCTHPLYRSERERGREREREERERERERKKEGENEECLECERALCLQGRTHTLFTGLRERESNFFKGMTGALAPLGYLVFIMFMKIEHLFIRLSVFDKLIIAKSESGKFFVWILFLNSENLKLCFLVEAGPGPRPRT